jgi:hypothetical protein
MAILSHPGAEIGGNRHTPAMVSICPPPLRYGADARILARACGGCCGRSIRLQSTRRPDSPHARTIPDACGGTIE